jgi:hypothetical protein
MVIGAMSGVGGWGGGASGGGGAGGRVESSLTKNLDFARFCGPAGAPAEKSRTLANRAPKTNKKRFESMSLTL